MIYREKPAVRYFEAACITPSDYWLICKLPRGDFVVVVELVGVLPITYTIMAKVESTSLPGPANSPGDDSNGSGTTSNCE